MVTMSHFARKLLRSLSKPAPSSSHLLLRWRPKYRSFTSQLCALHPRRFELPLFSLFIDPHRCTASTLPACEHGDGYSCSSACVLQHTRTAPPSCEEAACAWAHLEALQDLGPDRTAAYCAHSLALCCMHKSTHLVCRLGPCKAFRAAHEPLFTITQVTEHEHGALHHIALWIRARYLYVCFKSDRCLRDAQMHAHLDIPRPLGNRRDVPLAVDSLTACQTLFNHGPHHGQRLWCDQEPLWIRR